MDEQVLRSTFESQFMIRSRIFDTLYDSLKMLESVPDHWNSYGSPRPSAEAITVAETMLKTLRRSSSFRSAFCRPPRRGCAARFFRKTRIGQ